MTTYREQIAAVSEILKKRFNSLTTAETIQLSFDIVDAVMSHHNCRETAPEDPTNGAMK